MIQKETQRNLNQELELVEEWKYHQLVAWFSRRGRREIAQESRTRARARAHAHADAMGEEDQHNCGQEKDMEILAYRRHQYIENPNLRITGEDIMMVMECDHCGPAVTEYVRKDCEGCGQGWVREDYTLCILGNDVISLFMY